MLFFNQLTMKQLFSILFTLALAFGLALPLLTVSAEPVTSDSGTVFQGLDFGAALTAEDKPDIAVSSEFRQAVVGVINYILTFLGLAAVVFIIYAGILLVTAAGEEKNVETAKKIIIYAAVGIVIILLSYSIVNVVFGVKDVVA